MSATPRTDACAASQRDIGGGQSWWELCDSLENQLNAMTAAKNRAVEALKRAESILDSEYPATDGRHPRQLGLDKLIAELEEVK